MKVVTLLAGLLICSGSLVCVGQPLQPPFGLNWGDSPKQIVSWAVAEKLDQTVKAPGDQPQLKVLEVSAAKGTLPDHDASMLEARFMDGKLFEVALHYNYPGKSIEFVRARFAELRKILTQTHGALKPGGKAREIPVDGVTTRSTAYQVVAEPGSHLILVLTEVMDTKRADASARFSVVYHHAGVIKEAGPRVLIRKGGVDFPAQR